MLTSSFPRPSLVSNFTYFCPSLNRKTFPLSRLFVTIASFLLSQKSVDSLWFILCHYHQAAAAKFVFKFPPLSTEGDMICVRYPLSAQSSQAHWLQFIILQGGDTSQRINQHQSTWCGLNLGTLINSVSGLKLRTLYLRPCNIYEGLLP